MWIFVVAVLVCLVTYIYYTLATSSGSSYENNSIDAFIRKDNSGQERKQEVLPNQEDKYKKCYTVPGRQILIVYGTEYGFSEEVARYIFDRLAVLPHSTDNIALQPRLVNAKHHDVIDWSSEQICLIVISTSGDGVPPSDAEEFYNTITDISSNGQFSHIKYSVLAMGDSNYPQFCKTGRTIDKSFRNQSATCMVPCHEVDMEDWSTINSWLDQVTYYLKFADIEIREDYLDLSGIDDSSEHDRHNPFMAKIKVKKLLTVSKSADDKETIHCEFDISGSGLTWTSGDALGIYPQNNPDHVGQIITCLQYTGTEILSTPSWAFKPTEACLSLKSMLMKYYDLKHIKQELIQLLVGETGNTDIKDQFIRILNKGVSKTNTDLQTYLNTHEVIDVIKEFLPVSITPEKFVSCLKSLQPRYYSISSSPLVDPNTVCVTAAVVRYNMLLKPREGVTTTFLQDRLFVPESVPVFISRNRDFRLPSNPETPVILIGPGTGIAPFRAFIQERELQKVTGKTLLYFGCRHMNQDYLYRDELKKFEENGTIYLKVAFSRDQKHKIYVQDFLQEDSAMLWKLLTEEFAHLYVCGDAKHMAHDVHKMLLYIAQMEGNMNEASANEFLKFLENNSRYQKDVWIS